MKKHVAVFLGFLLLGFTQSAQAGELLNKHLPSYLKADIEFRHRMEYRQNFDFNDSADDEDAFDLLRARLNLQWTPVKPVKFFMQWQDSRIANDEFANKTACVSFMSIMKTPF